MSALSNTLVLNDIIIESRTSDNFVNATQLCKAGGKKLFADWYRLDSTKELIRVLEEDLKSNMEISISQELIDVKKGNSKLFTQGSWIHPDLAVQLAQWISPKFAIKVSRWTRELLITGSVSIDSKKTNEELNRLQKQLQENTLVINQKNALIEDSKKQIVKLEKKQLNLLLEIEDSKHIEKKQIFYIATTDTYLANSRFEFGGIKDISKLGKRITSYNTGRAEGDLMYVVKTFKCASYSVIENQLHFLLDKYKDKKNSRKEMVVTSYEELIELVQMICDHHNESVDYINSKFNQIFNKVVNNEIPNIKPELIFNLKKQKEDVSNWSPRKTEKKLEDTINRIVREQIKEEYILSQESNGELIEIPWGSVSINLKAQFKGMTTSQWKNIFRKLVLKKKPRRLKVKGIKI
jgi:hypothetical protein